MYSMSFLSVEVLRNGPVEGCRGRAATRAALRVNLLHRHIRDTMVILEDDKLHYPLFPRCYILVPWAPLNGQHTTTSQCDKGEERKQRRLIAEDMRAITARTFQAYVTSLNSVTSLKYLGHIMTASDDDCPELVGNLHDLRKSWSRFLMILRREGANPRVSEMFFKSVVQTVLLMGLETWTMTPRMGREIGGFQHRESIWITGRNPLQFLDGSW